jgi:hypothetical protein
VLLDFVDRKYVGPINTLNNMTGYHSIDGTCTGSVRGLDTVVRASDSTTAFDLCRDL